MNHVIRVGTGAAMLAGLTAVGVAVGALSRVSPKLAGAVATAGTLYVYGLFGQIAWREATRDDS